MDRTVKPGDDFSRFALGQWERTTRIPPDYPHWDSFNEVYQLTSKQVRDVAEAAARSRAARGTSARRVGDFYGAFMDEAVIEARGAAPLRPYLDRIAAIATRQDLARAFGEANRIRIIGPIRLNVWLDPRRSDVNAPFLSQSGLGLSHWSYYLDRDNARSAQRRAEYAAHVGNMLRLAGYPDPEVRAGRVLELETKIAQAHRALAQRGHSEGSAQPVTAAEMAGVFPGLDWGAYLEAAGFAGERRFFALGKTGVADLAALVASEPLQAWKDYLAFRTVSSLAPVLPRAFVEEQFELEKAQVGTSRLPERARRGVSLLAAIGDSVGQLYVERYFRPEAKAKIEVMVRNVVRAMDARLAALDWMSAETKVRARAKLAGIKTLIGHPARWDGYAGLKIRRDDALGNLVRSRAFEYERQLKSLREPVDRERWVDVPYSTSGYAVHAMRQIVFPAATLQPPFFDPNADDAVNYGAIGFTIGHELAHHFDDTGRRYDPNGNLVEWWTPADAERFQARADVLVRQYDAYEPLPGLRVNGKQTLGENIADLAGLAVAYDAYRLSLNGKEAPVIDGFTGDQRFFLGFAQSHRDKMSEPFLRQLLTSNPHTPSPLRINTVRNFDPWYRAFSVKDGALYLPPEKRVRIW